MWFLTVIFFIMLWFEGLFSLYPDLWVCLWLGILESYQKSNLLPLFYWFVCFLVVYIPLENISQYMYGDVTIARKGLQKCGLVLESWEGLHHTTSAVALGRPFNVLRTYIPTRVISRCIFIVLMLRISVAGLMCLLIFLNFHVLSIFSLSSFFVMNIWL